MSMQSAFEKAWYGKAKWIWLLFPLALLFGVLSMIRRQLYRFNFLSAIKLNVPIIVVGNISVGGNGKTPLVLAVAEYLSTKGYTVGVLSRGYKGSHKDFPHVVATTDTPDSVGDEPFLMSSRLNCKVVIDPVRSRGATALCELGCNVIICDDGLQHYKLQRDIELVVMDARQLGNGFLLPMGPLREGAWRLANIDMLICNGSFLYSGRVPQQVNMKLAPIAFVNVADPNTQVSCEAFLSRYSDVLAACAIGNPQRFYETLRGLGISISKCYSFADHHHFVEGDLPEKTVIMTEKDAVKCQDFAYSDWWYLKITADLPDAFYNSLTEKLKQLENL